MGKKTKELVPVTGKSYSGPSITSEVSNGSFKLFIDGTIHVSYDLDQYVGIHAWKHKGWNCIDFHLTSKKISTYYNKQDLWKKILEEINKKL